MFKDYKTRQDRMGSEYPGFDWKAKLAVTALAFLLVLMILGVFGKIIG